MKRFLLLTLILSHLLPCSFAQRLLQQSAECSHWVDSVMQTLSDEEKLGQLVMPMIVTSDKTNLSPEVKKAIGNHLTRYHAGGFLFSKVTLKGQADIDNEVQTQSARHKLPPALIGIDGEWGVVKRLADGVIYPSATIIGRIQNVNKRDSLCYDYGREMARQLHLLGVHINFAPVLDINSNASNPVIGTRSFGTRVDTVTACGLRYAHGLEDGGVLSVAKHFPGHGDTDKDSHLTLPRLNHSAEMMHQRELAPFQSFIDEGLGGMMVAHLDVPSLNGGKEGLPATASRSIVHDLLQQEMHFEGLVITDGLAMKGVSSRKDICVEALLAGCDIVLQPTPIDQQWQSMTYALKHGFGDTSAKDFRALVNEKCRKVLQWKYALIISQYTMEKGVPLVSTVNLNSAVNTPYANQLNVDLRKGWELVKDEVDPTMQTITAGEDGQTVPSVSALPTNPEWQVMTDRIDSIALQLVQTQAAPGCQILVAHKGEIIYHKAWGWMDAAHQERTSTNTYYDLASVSKVTGTLPALMYCVDRHGVKLTDNLQKYLPQFKGSSIGRLTIRQCLLHETGLPSGYPFYQLAIEPTSIPEGLYKGKKADPFTVQQDAKTWFTPSFKWDSKWVSDAPTEGFVPLAKDLWVNTLFCDEMITKMKGLTQKGIGRYRYSDLNFMLLRMVIEQVAGQPLDQLLYNQLPQIYGQPGKLIYKPLELGVAEASIAPTEHDDAIRRQVLRGYVHDETAAWSGGVEGNAGLFGSAEMLFPLLQSLLNEGWVNNRSTQTKEHLFSAATIKLFMNGKSGISRRGLGFDKPDTTGGKSPCSSHCSSKTVGHTGYTGTCFWVDPEDDLIYIFLSNRVCPHRWNTSLITQSYRSSIQDVIYEAIEKKE